MLSKAAKVPEVKTRHETIGSNDGQHRDDGRAAENSGQRTGLHDEWSRRQLAKNSPGAADERSGGERATGVKPTSPSADIRTTRRP